MKSKCKVGFWYKFQYRSPAGILLDEWEEHNIMPTEGMNLMLGNALAGTTPSTTWYLGIYQNNYAPQATDTASAFAGSGVANEFTGYTAATRPQWVPGSVAAGSVDNTASPAVYSFNTAGTIYGGFMQSTSGKGSLTGVLISAVQFSSARVIGASGTFTVTAGMALSN